MSEYKNLSITIEDIEKIISEFTSKTNGKYHKEEKPNSFYQFKIIVPGQKEALLNIYVTKRGVSVNPNVGSNKELSIQLADLIKKRSKKVETVSETFEGVFRELFNEFLEEFRHSGVEIERKQENDYQEVYKLMDKNKYEITVTYYKNKHKVFIQGKTTRLYDDIILWFADKIFENPREIIEIIFNSIEDFNKYEVKFPDDAIDELLKDRLGDLYDDPKIISLHEKKWLKTSFYLYLFIKEMPEYYPVIAGSLKIIEGILRRILIKKYGLKNAFKEGTKSFKHFRKIDENTYVMKEEYKRDFTNPHHIFYIESLYNFIKRRRDKLMHNLGHFPFVVEKREDAKNILDEVIDLIKKIEPFRRELL